MKNRFPRFFIAPAFALILGCGNSSSTNTEIEQPDDNTNSDTQTLPSSGVRTNSHTIVLRLMALNRVLGNSHGNLVLEIPDSDLTRTCAAGGRKKLERIGSEGDDSAPNLKITFDQCKEEPALKNTTLHGSINFKQSERLFEVSTPASQISISQNQNSIIVSDLIATTATNKIPVETTFQYTADLTSFNAQNVQVSTILPLTGGDLSCPTGGELLIVSSENQNIKVSDFTGGNMLVTVGLSEQYSVSCSEIISLVGELPAISKTDESAMDNGDSDSSSDDHSNSIDDSSSSDDSNPDGNNGNSETNDDGNGSSDDNDSGSDGDDSGSGGDDSAGDNGNSDNDNAGSDDDDNSSDDFVITPPPPPG